jgi:5-methylcytosine-specific restriction protein A
MANVFKTELLAQLRRAERRGAKSLEINSGELHRIVGGYPGRNHRMPICCDAMYEAQKAGDRVTLKPPKGKGASLTIRYRLPR